MKFKLWNQKIATVMLCAALFSAAVPSAFAQTYDADAAAGWLSQFAGALSAIAPINDPADTADPARAGEYLIEYEFGTVLSTRAESPDEESILAIDVRNDQVTDCRGVRVGMPLSAALEGPLASSDGGQLIVLQTQESGYGWSWAYMNADGVYGVEYITYGGEDAMTEYTLTYVIAEGMISAIRMRMNPATLAQAEDGLRTAEEIAGRQSADAWIAANSESAFGEADLQVMGASALGMPVDTLISRLGEPLEIQTLPQGGGRILVYDGAVVRLGLDEYTGVEIVRGVSVSGERFDGPRRLTVGMLLGEAASLFRCDEDLSGAGGWLYGAGGAEGAYGEAVSEQGGDDVTLRYVCVTKNNDRAVLEIGAQSGLIAYWHLYYLDDMSDTEGAA